MRDSLGENEKKEARKLTKEFEIRDFVLLDKENESKINRGISANEHFNLLLLTKEQVSIPPFSPRTKI